jgi:hypothetical protein
MTREDKKRHRRASKAAHKTTKARDSEANLAAGGKVAAKEVSSHTHTHTYTHTLTHTNTRTHTHTNTHTLTHTLTHTNRCGRGTRGS